MATKFTGVVLGIILACVSAVSTATATPESCTSVTSEAPSFIQANQRMLSYRIVGGHGDVPDFDGPMTRAEFATVLARTLRFNIATPAATDASPFSDMNGHWAAPYVLVLFREGIVRGNADGTYKPDELVTLGQAKLMLGRMLHLTAPGASPRDGHKALQSGGVNADVSCANDDSPATKAQAMVLVDRAMSLPLYARFSGVENP